MHYKGVKNRSAEPANARVSIATPTFAWRQLSVVCDAHGASLGAKPRVNSPQVHAGWYLVSQQYCSILRACRVKTARPTRAPAGRRAVRPRLSFGAFQLPEQERVRVRRFPVLLSARRTDAVACIVIDPQQDGLARVARHL